MERLQGILLGILEEEPLQDYPLSYSLSEVASTIRSVNPTKKQISSAFASLGFKSCQTFYNGELWKTDAPPEAVYDIFKKFKKEHTQEPYTGNVAAGSPAVGLLNKPLSHEADFSFEIPKE